MRTGALESRDKRSVSVDWTACGGPAQVAEIWHRFPSLFLGFALGHRAKPESQLIQFGGDRLDRRQLVQDSPCGRSTACGLPRPRSDSTGVWSGRSGRSGVGRGRGLGYRRGGGEADLDGLRPRAEKLSRQVTPEWSSCSPLDSIAPTQEEGGLTLTEVECLDRLGHEASALGTGRNSPSPPATHTSKDSVP